MRNFPKEEWRKKVSAAIGFIVLLLYPAVIFLLPEPAAARWGWRQRGIVLLPESLRSRSERNGRYLLLAKFALVIGMVIYSARRYHLLLSVLGVGLRTWPLSLIIGFVAGTLLLFWKNLLEIWFPRLRSHSSEHDVVRGGVVTWILIFLAGCFCEELWRAFCLTALRKADFSLPFVVVVTSISFALAELGGIPSRLLAIWEDVVAAMTIGVLLAVLFLAASSLLTNCSANLIFNLSNMYLMRKRYNATKT